MAGTYPAHTNSRTPLILRWCAGQGGNTLDLMNKILDVSKQGGQNRPERGCKSTLAAIRFFLAVSIIALSHGSVRAEGGLDKVLDWTFFPNEVIIFSDPSLITISGGGLHLGTMDQSDNATNSKAGYGFKKGYSTFNTIWDTKQEWLTVTQSINLPNGSSVVPLASDWANMAGNVLLLHFDEMPKTSFAVEPFPHVPVLQYASASVTDPVTKIISLPCNVPVFYDMSPLVAKWTWQDSSLNISLATCRMTPPMVAPYVYAPNADPAVPATYAKNLATINASLGKFCPSSSQMNYCPTYVPNTRVGGAMRFDGQNDELLVPNPTPSGSSELTVEAWVNPSLSQVGSVISQGGTNGFPNYEIGVQPLTVGMAATFKIGNNSISGGVMFLNTWNHIVATYNGSDMMLYVNGVVVKSQAASGQIPSSSQELVIGTSWVDSSNGTTASGVPSRTANKSSFAGSIDEVAVYTRALNSEEVVNHFSHQASVMSPDGSQVPVSGVFDSRLMSVGSYVPWNTLSWVPTAPYGIQLPDSNGSENVYSMANVSMSGDLVLLHLNEPFGATSFLDTSGQSNTGTCNALVYGVATTCPKMGQVGKFDKATMFNGSTDAISVPLPQGQSPTKAITLETWVYPTSNSMDTNVGIGLISKGPQSGTSGAAADFELGLSPITTGGGPGGTKVSLNPYFLLSNHTYLDPMPIPGWPNQTKNHVYGSYVPVGSWSHLVATYDGTTMKLYVNGELQMSQIVSGGDVANSNNPVILGMRSSTVGWVAPYCTGAGNTCYRNTHFTGKMDEVAIYNRVLSDVEVSAHFFRGVAKPKLQVRFCKQSDCSDGASFVGPGGRKDTYFITPAVPLGPQSVTQTVDLVKELNNTSWPAFQYRVLFESPYASSFPSVSSVSIDPPHTPTTNPSATVNTQTGFSQLTSFDDVVSGDGGEVLYQFSPDNTSWYFCSGNYWMKVPVDTPDISQITSPEAQIKNCLNSIPFSVDGGSGTMWFKAFFHSPNGAGSIDLNKVSLGYKTAVAPPVVVKTFVLGGGITQTVAEGSSLNFNIKLDAPGVDVTTPYTKMSCEGCPSSLKIVEVGSSSSVDVSYSPAYGEANTYTGTISILGANGKTATQAVTIVVAHADAVPKITSAVGDQSVVVGQQLSFVFSATIANGHPLTYTIVNPQSGMVLGADGLFTWTPTKAGSYAVTLRAGDKDVPTIYSDQTLTITVSSVDSPPPPKTESFTLNTNEGSELKFSFKKPDVSKAYTFSCSSGCPSGLSVDYNTGEVMWTPTYSQSGTYDLQFQIAGSEGTIVQPLKIVVKDAVAVPQIVNPGDKVVTAGQTLSFTLTAKDADGGAPNFVIASPKQDGMTLDANSGAFNWATKPEQSGSYIVTFQAGDSQNPNIHSDQSIVVTVNKSADIAAENLPEPTTPEAPSGTPTTTGTQSTTAQAATQGQPAEPAQPTTVSGCSLIR